MTDSLEPTIEEMKRDLSRYRVALLWIIDLNTAGANSTVKNMVTTAESALFGDHADEQILAGRA